METPEGKNITKIEEIVNNPAELQDSSAKVCVHESLWQCQSLFNDVQGKVGFKKIIFFTSDDNPHRDDPALRKQALMKAGDLSDTGIVLEVIPMANADFDMTKFYGDMITKDENETYDQEHFQQKLEDLFKLVRKRVHKKRPIAKFYFEFGHGVKLGVSSYNL